MGKSQRVKGHSFEREIARVFGGRRNLEYQVNEMQGVDVITERFIIQTKKYKKYCNPNKIEELPEVDGKTKLMVTAGDRMKPIVCIYLDDFMEILK